ncbi:MAG: hypothetical protein ACRDVE_18520 [Actinocrinis sp.]
MTIPSAPGPSASDAAPARDALGSDRATTGLSGALVDTPTSGARSDVRTAVRVGVTGHTDLGLDTIRLVARALRDQLRQVRDSAREREQAVVGVSCLAPGADCVFARVMLGLGGRLEVVLPATDYRESQAADVPRFAPVFDNLVRQADVVHTTGWVHAQPRAYAAANAVMLDSIDELIAVWDGEQSAALGGTAHAVGIARSRGIPVTVIWPAGARRG